MPADHAVPVRLERLAEPDQRLDPAGPGLGDPAGQVFLGGVGVELVEVVKAQRVLVRARCQQRLLK